MLLTFFEKKQETADVFSFIFKTDEPIKWRAGQYLFYTFPNDNPDNRGVTRYFTISSTPFEDFIIDDLGKNYIFIAGGIGITPFRSILLQMDLFRFHLQ